MKQTTTYFVVVICAVMLAGGVAVEGGTFTVSPWTNDADSGISAGKVYTHSGKFLAPVDAEPFYAGNGVWFEGDRDLQGVDWTLSNIPHSYDTSHEPRNVDGSGKNLLDHFVYGDDDLNDLVHPILELRNLTAGEKYIITCYAKGFGGPREVLITPSDDPNDKEVIDQGLYEGVNGKYGNGLLLKYSYLAPDSGTFTLTFDQVAAVNVSWHHYAFSNEKVLPVYIDPQPVPGSLVDLNVTLDFAAIPDEGVDTSNMVYNLHWGTDPNMTNKVEGLTEGSYALPKLAEATVYYWKAEILEDGEVIYTPDPNDIGAGWAFTTKTLAPAEKVLEYMMDQTGGVVVAENIGGFDGTAVGFEDPNEGGTAWVEGIVGNCLAFDGVGSYVDLGDEAVLPFGAGELFSISGYVKTTDFEGPLVTFRNSTDGGPILALVVGYDGDNNVPAKLRFISRSSDGGPYRLDGPVVTDGGWHHFGLVRDTDGSITLYVDGQSYGSVNDGLAEYDVDWRAIGSEIEWINAGHGSERQRYLDGLIDEVVVWSGALKKSQIDEMIGIIPMNPTPPMDGKAGLGVALKWSTLLPPIDDAKYNVYLGASADMSSYTDGALGLDVTEFTPTEPLEYDTRYFWQVEVVSGEEPEPVYTSPIWTFTTVPPTPGTFSFQPWTSDGDSGLSSNKTYTHAVNFSATGTDGELIYAGNGVYFENDVKASGVNYSSGSNWSLTGAQNVFWVDHSPPITGDSVILARRFYFNEQAGVLRKLTLTGLTIGTKYITTFYTTSFGTAGERYVKITPGDNPYSPTRIDQNALGGSNGRLIKYTYTATSTEMSFEFEAENKANTWHHYAFSNEIAPIPLPFELTPSPGSGETVGIDVELGWQPVPPEGASGATYNLYVATDAEMTNLIVERTGLDFTSFAPAGLQPATQYFWVVDGVLDGEVAVPGPVWTFYTASTTPATKLVEWKMDEAWGTVAAESSGSGIDGTLVNFEDPNNTGWADGIEGSAVNLDGVDDYVDLGDTTALTAPQGYAFSISGYVRTNDSEGPIFAMRNTGILAVYVGFDGTPNVPGHFRFISASGGLRQITGPRVDDGLWHHFAVTRSTFGKVELYIDGVSAGTTNDLAGQYTNAWSAFGTDLQWQNDWVGQGLHPHDWYHLEGQVDEITIWQDELQPDQITALVDALPIPGDVDGDGDVDFEDVRIVAAGWLTNDAQADINGSGWVDLVDFGILSGNWQ